MQTQEDKGRKRRRKQLNPGAFTRHVEKARNQQADRPVRPREITVPDNLVTRARNILGRERGIGRWGPMDYMWKCYRQLQRRVRGSLRHGGLRSYGSNISKEVGRGHLMPIVKKRGPERSGELPACVCVVTGAKDER